MAKLDPTAQIKFSKSLLASILKQYNLQLRSFKIAEGGIENTTAIITTNHGKYALRVYRKNKKVGSHIQQELAFMDLLRTSDLPIPQVFRNNNNSLITIVATQKNTWSCILMELMEGNHLKTYPDTFLKDLAIAQAKMHKLGIAFARTQPNLKKLKTLTIDRFLANLDSTKIRNTGMKEMMERTKQLIIPLST